MQGIDIFDMTPLPADRVGMWLDTLKAPDRNEVTLATEGAILTSELQVLSKIPSSSDLPARSCSVAARDVRLIRTTSDGSL